MPARESLVSWTPPYLSSTPWLLLLPAMLPHPPHVQREGTLALFKGAIPRACWIAPLGAMNFAGYEIARQALLDAPAARTTAPVPLPEPLLKPEPDARSGVQKWWDKNVATKLSRTPAPTHTDNQATSAAAASPAAAVTAAAPAAALAPISPPVGTGVEEGGAPAAD